MNGQKFLPNKLRSTCLPTRRLLAGAKVTRIDTHAAAVFLAGDHAYKIKRAVKFPFLDFSTLGAAQGRAREAEIEANRPFAPELYLGLIPIVRERGKSLRLAAMATPSTGC